MYQLWISSKSFKLFRRRPVGAWGQYACLSTGNLSKISRVASRLAEPSTLSTHLLTHRINYNLKTLANNLCLPIQSP
jgi:hypothetical protein